MGVLDQPVVATKKRYDPLLMRSGTMGMDPELFLLDQKGEVIGAEKVVPKKISPLGYDHLGSMLPDGIQIEFNPLPQTCRALLCKQLVGLFKELDKTLDQKGSVSFDGVIEVSQAEMDSLSEESKKLGCEPSKNLYTPSATVSVPDGYRIRTAAGHLHFGHYASWNEQYKKINPAKFIPLCDFIIGSPCVMIDRDPGQIERRKTYGRAGEYRTPPHGVEYRTLSNFWLRDCALTSFVLGMGRIAFSAFYTNRSNELINLMNMEKVIEAINTNNATLARENWEDLKPWLMDSLPRLTKTTAPTFPLGTNTLEHFEFFLSKPLEHWFPSDGKIVERWKNISDCHYAGWETFLFGRLAQEMNKEKENGSRT